jgi:hypothetical protein
MDEEYYGLDDDVVVGEPLLARFERLCRAAKISTVSPNFLVTQDDLFNFFKVVIGDCEKNGGKKIFDIDKTEFRDSTKAVYKYLVGKREMRTRDISEKARIPMRTVQEAIKFLSEKKLLINVVGKDKINYWRVKK